MPSLPETEARMSTMPASLYSFRSCAMSFPPVESK